MLFVSAVVCLLLTACNRLRDVPNAFTSLTPEPSHTATAIATSTLLATQTRIAPTEIPSTPTFTPFPPYHSKKVIFEYYIVGQQSYFDAFYADCCQLPRIILYDDGQMLVNGRQKVLSSDEIKVFLSKLDAFGFFTLESNQQHDLTDKLYDFGNNYQEVNDGLKYCILVNAEKTTNLCAREDYMQYLIPNMKTIFKYLDKYKPTGLTPYYPDRILLSIEPVDSNSSDLPATATPWDNRFPSLEFSPPQKYLYDNSPPIMYIEGDMAKEIYIFITNSPDSDVFTQNGKQYRVQLDVVLPHETVINDYQ